MTTSKPIKYHRVEVLIPADVYIKGYAVKKVKDCMVSGFGGVVGLRGPRGVRVHATKGVKA